MRAENSLTELCKVAILPLRVSEMVNETDKMENFHRPFFFLLMFILIKRVKTREMAHNKEVKIKLRFFSCLVFLPPFLCKCFEMTFVFFVLVLQSFVFTFWIFLFSCPLFSINCHEKGFFFCYFLLSFFLYSLNIFFSLFIILVLAEFYFILQIFTEYTTLFGNLCHPMAHQGD